MPLAYSYIRFSTPEQATGDSLRRQTEARDKWLADHPDVKLDTSLRMTDAGRSGFNRENWDTYALAEFVEHVKAKHVKPGSYLLVENLDRLSREEAGEAVELFLSVVNKGVVIVQLMPTVLEFRKPVNTMSLMFAIVELSRGHSESAAKSARSTSDWANKQKNAGVKVVTRRVPCWIRVVGDAGKKIKHTEPGEMKYELVPEKAAVVRRMFAMAVAGDGVYTITKVFNEENVPVLGRKTMKARADKSPTTVKWADGTVRAILTSPACVGTYVPFNKRNKTNATPESDPVKNYYPAVVDEVTFAKAQTAMELRAVVGRGRRGKRVNLFSGLLFDARSNGPMTYRHSGKTLPVLVPVAAIGGRGGQWVSFPALAFERAVLSFLKEVSASDVEGDDARNKVEVLTARRDELSTLIKTWEDKMDDVRIVDRVAKKLAELGPQLKAVCAELEVAEREVATPFAQSWGEFKSLADLLEKDNSDEMRLKVRSVLRRCVESVYCLFYTIGKCREAMVHVSFRKGGARRHYHIAHQQGFRSGRAEYPQRYCGWSMATTDDFDPLTDKCDLRDKEWVRKVESNMKTHTRDLIVGMLDKLVGLPAPWGTVELSS